MQRKTTFVFMQPYWRLPYYIIKNLSNKDGNTIFSLKSHKMELEKNSNAFQKTRINDTCACCKNNERIQYQLFECHHSMCLQCYSKLWHNRYPPQT